MWGKLGCGGCVCGVGMVMEGWVCARWKCLGECVVCLVVLDTRYGCVCIGRVDQERFVMSSMRC